MKYILQIIIFSFLYINLNAQEIEVSNYFKNCDKDLNNGYFRTCYNYTYKSATSSYAEIDGKLVNSLNINERSSFYEDKNIPEEYRAKDSDFLNSHFDKGHIQSDASNDYSEESKKATYVLSNITMQYPNTNRRSNLAIEKRERELATIYGKIKSLTLIEYSEQSVKGIRIPSSYAKILFNADFSECYYLKNDNIIYTLEQMKKDCSIINKL